MPGLARAVQGSHGLLRTLTVPAASAEAAAAPTFAHHRRNHMPLLKYRPALATTALGLVTALTTLPAAVQFQKPEDAIRCRQSAA